MTTARLAHPVHKLLNELSLLDRMGEALYLSLRVASTPASAA